MGRTIPTATQLLRRAQEEWKPFRQQLSEEDRKIFDEMFSLAHIHNYAMMMSLPSHPVAIQPIFMSIVFYHFKQLQKMMAEV